MELKKIGQLAKLELSDEEERELASDFEKIINFVKALEEIDTSNIEPFFAFEKLENMREDDIEKFEFDNSLLKLVDGYFRVQRIVER
ncbi:MAG: Asp-tRNA(Asn)/Glu-tRNA(Gln) amidotransferase subunit GatC [Aquificaceae bacterium]|nr:Asp-tRNA(Asn)/Glu-tRNA(Gln) amidotransferase subunit GatC [Aquificaceae bacterium]MDW8236828.1 Asp-tRNA(Asn)/Glu-tRNA(Gln) amidotransferase subunit GatC [Aquificaceae bacterium]